MGSDGNFSRRKVLGALAGASLGAAVPASSTTNDQRADMIYRTFGQTGIKVSAVGLEGSHVGSPADENDGIRIVRTAIDHGITFIDNCWDYYGGESEVVLGKALRDGYREKVFLMTKFDCRTKESAARQIDESLRRLQTDHIDPMQFHENIRLEDPDRSFASGEPLEAPEEAKRAGKIRFIGFTAHKDPIIHLRSPGSELLQFPDVTPAMPEKWRHCELAGPPDSLLQPVQLSQAGGQFRITGNREAHLAS
jgi:hypothetical protein